jgi:hypothetical protein
MEPPEHPAKWHHCRACGEEGLAPEDPRCPLCGVRNPVTLCDVCGLPIREGEPKRLRAVRTDRPDETAREWLYHEACYAKGKRQATRRYRPPDWRLFFDPGDDSEPLTPFRWLAGLGMIVLCAVSVIYLVSRTPLPEPVFSGGKSPPRDLAASYSPMRGFFAPSTGITFFGCLLAAGGILGGLWLIRWGLNRRRALFWNHLTDSDLPPER